MQEVTQNEFNQEDLKYYESIDINNHRDIQIVDHNYKKLFIVGTAHVSKKSQLLVKKVLNECKPELVCIELDNQRYEAVTKKNRWESLDIYKVIKKKQTFFLITQLLLAGFQKRMGKKLGVKPGAEMIEAINVAKENNIPIELVDRNVATTLKRAWRQTPFFKKLFLISNLLTGFFSKQDIDEERLSTLRKSDVITEMMSELQKHLPEAKTVLIDERDTYLITKTLQSDAKNIVLVVGAGHVQGIINHLKNENVEDVDLDKLDHIPEPAPLMQALPWIIPAAIFIALIVGFVFQDYETMKKSIYIWILANGVFSVLGSIIAFAHPFSIITSFVAAPITSLNPTIGCGLVVGLAESYFRKPRVLDFHNLSEDIESIRGWYHNRLTRILLAFIGSSIGSAVGTWVAISWILAT